MYFSWILTQENSSDCNGISTFRASPLLPPCSVPLPAAPHLVLQHTKLFLHLSLSHINCSERQNPQALKKLLLKLMRLGTRSSYRELFARATPYLLLETAQKSLLHWQFSSPALTSTQVRNIFCFTSDLTVTNTTVRTHHLTLYDLGRGERAKIIVSL